MYCTDRYKETHIHTNTTYLVLLTRSHKKNVCLAPFLGHEAGTCGQTPEVCDV